MGTMVSNEASMRLNDLHQSPGYERVYIDTWRDEVILDGPFTVEQVIVIADALREPVEARTDRVDARVEGVRRLIGWIEHNMAGWKNENGHLVGMTIRDKLREIVGGR